MRVGAVSGGAGDGAVGNADGDGTATGAGRWERVDTNRFV